MTSRRDAVVEELAAALAAIEVGHPARVGIDGVDAAGKTVLADELAPRIEAHGRPVVRVSVDDFHRPRDERYRLGELSPEGYYLNTFDYEGLRQLLLEPLGTDGSRRVRFRSWDYRRDEPVAEEWRVVSDDAVLLCEGIFLQREELRQLWDVTVFVAAELDVAVERAIQRDAAWMPSFDATRERYRLRYAPAQKRYLDEQRPHDRADFVFENTDPRAPVLIRHRDNSLHI